MRSFDADVAATRRILDKAGPCVLVGHSYGGMIITEAGKHPDVKALVYVAAFQPDCLRARGTVPLDALIVFQSTNHRIGCPKNAGRCPKNPNPFLGHAEAALAGDS
jgi:pimeloyl-ACP methyl ester carboxylesterase